MDFFEKIKALFLESNKLKLGLLFLAICLTFFSILFSNLSLLPLKTGDFIFLVLITLAFSAYRPGWAFLFFIASIPLENIILSPENLPLNLRPYQILALTSFLAVLIRIFAKKLNFPLPKWKWFDILPPLMALSGFVSAALSQDKSISLKLSLVLFSFVLIYFLTRIFIQETSDIKRITPFFLSSSLVVIFYGIWQNWSFTRGLTNFEVMPGRPNGTFAEADWLGAFSVLLLSALFALIYNLNKKEIETYQEILGEKLKLYKKLFLWSFVSLVFIILILTVSRSAWLGGAAASGIFLLSFIVSFKDGEINFDLENFLRNLFAFLGSLVLSIALIYFFHLTDFQLGNRLGSTTSGLQKITISCQDNRTIPEKIDSVDELKNYSCRHINLEEIESEKSLGRIVKEIERTDPNFDIRSQIYEKSWQEIKSHPIFGIGWGNIGRILGTDSLGNSLNSSNLFLEIYLGSGLVGFLSFLTLWFLVLGRSLRLFFSESGFENKIFAFFIILAWTSLSIFNLFNSGIMLGFLWVFLGISLIKIKKYENRN